MGIVDFFVRRYRQVAARWPAAGWLYLSFALEVYFFTWGRGIWGAYFSPVVFTLAGIGVGVSAMRLRPNLDTSSPLPRNGRRWWQLTALVGLLSGGVAGLARMLSRLYSTWLIRIQTSDILPAIRIYVRRFLWGSGVYRPFDAEVGYALLPGYLPATWLPFVAAEWTGADYRWVSAAGLLLGIGAAWWWVLRQRPAWGAAVAAAAVPLLVVYAVIRTDSAIFAITAEALVAGYFLLFGVALLSGSVVARALALTLCLLSRYFIAVWLPLLGLLLLWQEGWRRTAAFGALVAALVTAIYVWPVLTQWPELPLKVQAAYGQVALAEWQHNINTNTGLPYHPFNGLGLAPWFYPTTPTPASVAAAIAVQQRVQLALLTLVVVGGGLRWTWLRRFRPTIAASTGYVRWYAVGSLKLFLVVFYGFLHVPYSYLILVSVLFSTLLVMVVGATQVRQADHTSLSVS